MLEFNEIKRLARWQRVCSSPPTAVTLTMNLAKDFIGILT